MYQFHPAILAVNRQINLEASQTLRGNFFVRVTLDFQFDTNSLPVVAKEDLACRVTYPAIDVSIVDMAHSHLNADTRSFMIAGDDMATFCRILSRKYPFPGSVWIAITGVAQTTTVLKLLEPFRRVHGMASVRITGLIEGDYRSDLITKMLEEAPNGDTVLQELKNTINEGDQAASIHDYLTAISRFRKALDDTDDYWTIYDTAKVIVEKGVFNGQSLTVVFAQVLAHVALKIVMMNLKLQNFSRWDKLGLANVMERILRSEALKLNRASDVLALQKLMKVLRNYVDYVNAFADSLMEMMESRIVWRMGQTWHEGAECGVARSKISQHH